MNSVTTKAIEVVAAVLQANPGDLRADTSLKRELQVDSTEMVDIVVGLEKAFGVRIDQGQQKHFESISDIVDCVEQLVDAPVSA